MVFSDPDQKALDKKYSEATGEWININSNICLMFPLNGWPMKIKLRPQKNAYKIVLDCFFCDAEKDCSVLFVGNLEQLALQKEECHEFTAC